MKKCGKCGVFMSLDSFHRRGAGRDGLRGVCKNCYKSLYYSHPEKIGKIKQKQKDWRQLPAVKERLLNYRLMKSFGITLEEYNSIFKLQNGVCAICKSFNLTGKNLAVDHDHKTGRVRGLLCNNCNLGIGKFKDSIDLLKMAIEYLEYKVVRHV